MSWVKLDDGFAQHPKVAGLSDRAFRAHVKGLCYCGRFLTDGRIPRLAIRELGITPKTAKELEDAGLWRAENGSYWLHDYLEYNPPREEVLADREIARRRSAMNANPALARAIKERDGNECRYCGIHVNWRDRKSATGGTYDHVIPVSKGGDESVDNLVTACRSCNFKKGPRTPEEAGMVLRIIQPESGRDQNGTQTTRTRPDPVPVLELPSVEGEISKGNAVDVGWFLAYLADSTESTQGTLEDYRRRLPEAAFHRALEALKERKAMTDREPLVSETRYFVATLNSMLREEQYA